jgi:hypothetical protein
VDDDAAAAQATPTAVTQHPPGGASSPDAPVKIPLLGARARARELSSEVARLNAEVASLHSEMARLGVLELVELEQRKDSLSATIDEQEAMLTRTASDQHERLEREEAAAAADMATARQRLQTELADSTKQLDDLNKQIVVASDAAMLQEVGIYEYRHPLDDAVAYQAELARLKDAIRAMTRRDGGAVQATTQWTVNSSAAAGRAMVRDFSKLMLRAYNAEADNLVRGLKPYKLASAIDRLTKVAITIEKLGRTMSIRITDDYHRLRIKELELTADYLEKVAQEREREREEKARLREERQAQLELERERQRLDKERQHHANALQALLDKGDAKGAQRMRDKLAEIDAAIEQVDYRVANVRAGYVYVISNIGSFGERMVKVGMTRRLEPLDRVRELGDASVPFRFDVHALFFSDDAVGIEAQMHARLEDHRVNRVNPRREFFYCTPQEAKAHLLDLTGELLQFEELPEALEFRQSRNQEPAVPPAPTRARPKKAAKRTAQPAKAARPRTSKAAGRRQS